MLKEINPELFERLRKIDGSREFFESLDKPLRKSVRINTLKASVEIVVERLFREGILEEKVP
ncbi:MAG: tRNA methyltransferase, partial [Archaeoglobaceae archaeon]